MTLAIEVIVPSSDAAERRGEAVAAVARVHRRADNGGAAGAVDWLRRTPVIIVQQPAESFAASDVPLVVLRVPRQKSSYA